MTVATRERCRATPTPFAANLGRHGGRLALVTSEGQTLTYAELSHRSQALVDRLGPVRRLVLLEAGNNLDSIVAYLACLAADHPVIVTPAGSPFTERLVAHYDPDVVLSAGQEGWWVDERREGTRHELHPELALVLSTSGSTGSPKLVRLSQVNLQSNAVAIADYLELTERDRAATTLPMAYCYGLSVINSHLSRGASLLVTGLSVVDTCFWDAFHREQATSFAGVPHTFDLLDRVRFEELDLPHLRYVTQAGGRLSPERVRWYAQLGRRRGWDFYVMYGQTEATARIAYLPPHLAASHPGSIGVPVPGGSLEIEPVEGLPAGEGELVYRGPNVMLGYAESPSDLALGRTVEVLRTGDLGRRNPQGLYEITGRARRFVKPFGLRVDLDRVEQVLGEHGHPALCTGDDQRLLVAIAGSDPDAAATAEQLVAAFFRLPPAAVQVRLVGELPRLANGKPDYATVASWFPPAPSG
ncbi:AMP-binding protein, partial [Rhabdothermincola sp.]|uniref:AMP-binding protein n=1 Tax=Rhabdothermincola sp. TaxID=2820405 RepID=UPI002FDF6C36